MTQETIELKDAILPLLGQWGTIVLAVMGLAEFASFKTFFHWFNIGTTSTVPGKGTNKRIWALIYSLILSYAAWYGTLLKLPMVPEGDGRQIAAVGVIAIVSVVLAHGIHAAKQRVLN
jgi:hypothetical protein